MSYDDMNFTILDKNGKEVFCDIISIIPSEDKEKNYVVFTDYSKDINDEIVFMYGTLVQDGDDVVLENGVSDVELEYIKGKVGPDVSKHIIDYLEKEYKNE